MNNHVGKAETAVNLRTIALIRDAFAGSPLTQHEVADRAGIPRSTFANIVRPHGVPRLISAETLVCVAYALGADAHAWMDELEHVRQVSEAPDDLSQIGGFDVPNVRKMVVRGPEQRHPSQGLGRRSSRSDGVVGDDSYRLRAVAKEGTEFEPGEFEGE